MRLMPELTRRRDPHLPDCWCIHYGHVHVGTIGCRARNAHNPDAPEWSCGFYPGSESGEHRNGTAATFEEARAAFEDAWHDFLSKRTEADFQAWRDQCDWTALKYAMWAKGEKLPSQVPSSLMQCVCGETFDSHDPAGSLEHRRHIYSAQRTALAPMKWSRHPLSES
jgi:hypothetical protein